MKLITYQFENNVRLGAVRAEAVIDLTPIATDMLSLIESGSSSLAEAEEFIKTSPPANTLDEVTLLAPIPNPRRNIFCLGLNYAEHADESYSARGKETKIPDFPIIFTKATTAVTGPYSPIPFDPDVSTQIDWEAEMAFIIGRKGKNITPQEAMDYVFGYTIINDISARDLQWQHKQYFKGKSLDGSCPMGPWIVTAAEIPQPNTLNITSRVNGIQKQNSNTRHMIFDIPAIIYHLSRGMTLLPGDIVATGTPSGVGFARQPPEFLFPGDQVTCEIEGLGLISNTIQHDGL